MSSLQSQSTKSSALLVEMDRTHLEDLEKLATMVSDQRNMRHGKRIRSRNKQKKRDPTRIPRPMNCFMAYRLEKQKEIADFCPGANHRDISKIVAKWWKKEPDSVKQKYRVMAEKAKQEHSAMWVILRKTQNLIADHWFGLNEKVSSLQVHAKEKEDDNER